MPYCSFHLGNRAAASGQGAGPSCLFRCLPRIGCPAYVYCTCLLRWPRFRLIVYLPRIGWSPFAASACPPLHSKRVDGVSIFLLCSHSQAVHNTAPPILRERLSLFLCRNEIRSDRSRLELVALPVCASDDTVTTAPEENGVLPLYMMNPRDFTFLCLCAYRLFFFRPSFSQMMSMQAKPQPPISQPATLDPVTGKRCNVMRYLVTQQSIPLQSAADLLATCRLGP